MIDLFSAAVGAAVASFMIFAITRIALKRQQLSGIDGAVIPSNSRLVSTDGHNFFTTRKAIVIGGMIVVPVRKEVRL